MGDILPDHIMLDVLSRLPVKSIIYCKCVCKSWRDLVSNPCFVNLHLSRSREALLIHERKTSDYRNCSPGSLQCVEIKHEENHYVLNPITTLDLKRCAPLVTSKIDQVGSVNGLICLCRPYDSIYIFNPVLEEYMILPQPKLNSKTISYGFGVSKTGEYKVIRISERSLSLIVYVCVIEIEVYTIGTNHWRVLGQIPYHFISDKGPSVYVNNHVYWLDDGQIHEFDLTSETFELFPSPSGTGDNRQTNKMLGVLKGCLSWISWCSVGLDVWVMREGSWRKAITMQENINDILKLRVRWRRPLCLMDGLEGTSILMIYDRSTIELVAYCLNTNMVMRFNWRGNFNRVMTYRPSFVKLPNFESERDVLALLDRATLNKTMPDTTNRRRVSSEELKVIRRPGLLKMQASAVDIGNISALDFVYSEQKPDSLGNSRSKLTYENIF